MRRITPALCLVTALLSAQLSAPPLAAQTADPGISATINGQIEALRKDDFDRAFDFASPTIRQLFGTAPNFGTMVRQGYPMVHRPGAVRLLELRDVAGRLWQRVMITDTEGRTHLLDYEMQQGPGGWQINGVQILPDPGPMI
ncbi:DUF4864 domain-containing protein [Szabonella alba]|uniref:DUF4864 domain-containing protein n=1 Tax=Szabonella alba TaxID=2804194 RepID=A0A8K0Y1S6_9RHOB|nr:DUF4864 domain-containing protein [Szabonella alba]MBL4918212.1 DUF4864 domain-containing protein [Szabonella alba]